MSYADTLAERVRLIAQNDSFAVIFEGRVYELPFPLDKTYVLISVKKDEQEFLLGADDPLSEETLCLSVLCAEETGSELFELETQKPYPTDSYSRLTQIAKDEQNKKARPALKADIDITTYDTIFIGYPNWWGDMPMPVYTFLEAHIWSGKTIIPFCTHEGSGLGGSERDLKKICQGATFGKGFSVAGHDAANSEAQVAAWAKSQV